MRNTGLPWVMWRVYKKQYEKALLLFEVVNRKAQMKKVSAEYARILGEIPSYGKNDVLLINLLSAVAVAAVYNTLPQKPSVEQMQEYYRRVMDSGTTKAFLRLTNPYTARYQRHLCKQAALSQQATNPFTWRFTYQAGSTLECFDAVFDQCGIYALFVHLGIPELTPALCAYDYDMAKITGTIFTRAYTLASGGPVCDCHYQKASHTEKAGADQ